MTKKEGARVRIAVAGAGAISQLVHLPILSERRDVEVVALSDRDDLKAGAIGQRFGVGSILTDEEITEREDIDGVVVCAPTHRHEDLAIRALTAGKQVLVERPMALTAQGVTNILDAAKAAGTHVVADMAHRYRPDVSALRAFRAGGELGTISAVHGSWLNRKVRHVRTTWRQRREQAGGGALIDLGVQALDLILWVLGYPEIESVNARIYGDDPEVEEEAHLDATTVDGTTIGLSTSWRYFGPDDVHDIRILGSEGAAQLPPLSVYKQLGGRPMDVTPRQPIPRGGEDLFTNAYRRQIDHFIRVVGGEAEATPPTDQVALMALLEAAYASARGTREGRGPGGS
ncbi:MAG: Gfo/Idh/MocA family protein [Longimicrobiales bacterium]